jgi:putative ubiquitin-RnfH superfamily antitoxin RatB of RatAB toxin-antitoxin module
MIQITIAYATPHNQVEIPLSVEESCTIAVAIKRSGILQEFPEIKFATIKVGIHSKRVPLDASLHDRDRIEIYRPLIIDPKQARLLRAKSAKKAKKKN